MKVPFTKKQLAEWAGAQVVRDAEALVDRGLVINADYDPPHIRGTIRWNNRDLKTSLHLVADGTVESKCPCYANIERGVICAHVIALAEALVRRATDPLRDLKYREELRRASRLAAVREADYIQRVTKAAAGTLPAALHVVLGNTWREDLKHDRVPLACQASYHRKRVPLDRVPLDITLQLPRKDDAILFVLEDISEGPAKGEMNVSRSDFVNLIKLHAGRNLEREEGPPIKVNDVKVVTHIRMDLDRETGELILMAHTELPFAKPTEFPVYVTNGRSGWVYGADNFWPLENVLPLPYQALYEEPVVVARPDVLRFLRTELPTLAEGARVISDLSLDLFTVDPATPLFHLVIRGSAASLSATLHARYGSAELIAGRRDPKAHFAIPDPDDLMRYTVRNPEAETEALHTLARYGLSGEHGNALNSIVGKRVVLNFLGSGLPALRRQGWRVDMVGRVEPYLEGMGFATPVVHVHDERSANGWFEVGFDFESPQGESLSAAEIQNAIRKGECYVQRGDGVLLLDVEAIQSMQEVFEDCSSGESDRPGHFALPNIYAPYVKSSLDALDGIDVEETPDWRRRAEQQNRALRFEEAPLPDSLAQILRKYQRDGVNWLRFLELNDFSGLLADEMGLGKTVQTLAWLQTQRHREDARAMPALIVCPTSLVENWAAEAKHFVPHLRTQIMSGSSRHEHWDKLAEYDAVITSYALLRRDLERYLEHEFSAAILDEAQHIKNRSTQNAVAAKKVRAVHRLVLTGTPVENSVSDLWSIMDFLMPGYLGRHDAFRANYEIPISHGGPEAMAAQTKLRRKLHPFMLRRLKTEVARDLPPKIEKVSLCSLTRDQQLVYKELLDSSRRRLTDMVSERGLNQCRFEILKTLMRLRQACCHLDLLKLPGLDAKRPSAKMELFFELLDEAIDGGHRVLVFSQFVSMLTILRGELDRRSLSYCYLDGATKDRLNVVQTFNMQRDIPVFLISLKAGGTGLNLTGADMVIHFDPWWNPAVEDQATDRAYRIGQKRTVYSMKLITRGTVEEKVLELQHRKKLVIDATVEGGNAILQNMNWDDVREVLSM